MEAASMTTIPHDEMAPLTAAYIRAWQAIQREQDLIANDLNQFRRRRRLRSLEASVATILDRLDDYSQAFIRAQLPKVYASGGIRSASTLGLPFNPTQIDTDTVARMSRDLFEDLLSHTNLVREETKVAIRRALKDGIIRGEILGETPATTRRMLKQQMDKLGIRGVRYANGAWHTLDDYAEMAIRTKEAITRNVGGLEYGRRHGVEWYECLDGPDCGLTAHGEGELANGMIAPYETAIAYPVSHPNCRRVWVARPDLKTADDAANADPLVTEDQIADQREADRLRREAQRRRTQAARRREALVARRERRLAS